MLFKVVFQDDSTYDGKDYYNTGWSEMPDKPIKNIFVYLPTGGTALFMYKAEQYILFCEATTDLTGKNRGKPTLRYQYLMGKYGDKTLSYRISLWEDTTSKQKLGDLTTRILEWGKEDNGINPIKGWKKGII